MTFKSTGERAEFLGTIREMERIAVDAIKQGINLHAPGAAEGIQNRGEFQALARKYHVMRFGTEPPADSSWLAKEGLPLSPKWLQDQKLKEARKPWKYR